MNQEIKKQHNQHNKENEMNQRNETFLDAAEVMHRAPSVFADAPANDLSSKYLFVPTKDIVKQLAGEGFRITQATQSRAKTPDGKVFAKHMLRFRHESKINKKLLDLGDSVSEIILVNSHNGLSAFQFSLGLFRLVCSNGLIASENLASASVRHSGFNHDKIIDAVYTVLDNEPKLVKSVQSMRKISLTQPERIALASSALDLKYDKDDTKPHPEQLLTPRRYQDKDMDLWTTFNVVQENILRGGIKTIRKNERGQFKRNTTRGVNSVSENKRLNQALWTLAEEMKKLKAG